MSWGTLGLRLAIVVAAIIGIWRGASMLWGDTHDPATHLLRGACISLMVLALVVLLLRLDRLRGSEIGQLGPAANVRAFALGAGLWLLPALVGAALCIALGWASISLRSTPSTILLALPPLALGVFLVEAFPEELALRGYVQGLVARKAAPWVALLAQMVVFVGFGWAVGALHSVEQWMFIPGLALILGYVRVLTGNVWASMGVHCTWMTSTQLLNGHAAVEGLQTLQFLAFALLPSATIGAALGVLNPGFSWRRAAAA